MRTIGYVVLSVTENAPGGVRFGTPLNRADFDVETDIFLEFDDAEKVLTGMSVQYPENRYQVAEISVRED